MLTSFDAFIECVDDCSKGSKRGHSINEVSLIFRLLRDDCFFCLKRAQHAQKRILYRTTTRRSYPLGEPASGVKRIGKRQRLAERRSERICLKGRCAITDGARSSAPPPGRPARPTHPQGILYSQFLSRVATMVLSSPPMLTLKPNSGDFFIW